MVKRPLKESYRIPYLNAKTLSTGALFFRKAITFNSTVSNEDMIPQIGDFTLVSWVPPKARPHNMEIKKPDEIVWKSDTSLPAKQKCLCMEVEKMIFPAILGFNGR